MAELKIYNDIVGEDEKIFMQWFGGDGVCFKDVDSFVSSIPKEDNSILLKINCRGGLTSEGLAIYDALRASGKEISAEVIGQCSSSATIILLAAKKELRRAHPNAYLLIHEPYVSGLYQPCRAEDLNEIATDLQKETDRFLAIYEERTGADRETLSAIMKEDRLMYLEEAKKLGFIASVIAPKSAINNINKNRNKEMKKTAIKDAFVALGRALGVADAVGMELQTVNGDVLTIEKESGDPAVGDVASPDGEFVMPDGSTIVVGDGVISEIRPSEEEEPSEDDELKKAKAEIESLKTQLEEKEEEKKKSQANAKSKDEIEILNAVKIAGGKEWLMKAKSNYVVAGRSQMATSTQKVEVPKVGLREYINNKKK